MESPIDSPVGLCYRTKKWYDRELPKYYMIIDKHPDKRTWRCVSIDQSLDGFDVNYRPDFVHESYLTKMECVSRDEYDQQFYRAIQWLTEKHQEAK